MPRFETLCTAQSSGRVFSNKSQRTTTTFYECPTDDSNVLDLLTVLKMKDNGWNCLITYLRNNGHKNLADSLETEASGSATAHVDFPLEIETFTNELVN